MDKKKILIIDDEPSFTRMVKLNLEKTDHYIVREENNATQGLAAAREFGPDLILMDVRMPAQDGGIVAFRILAEEKLKDTPIIFLTAMVAHEETEKHPLRSGGFEFLGKPVDLETLVDCIEKNLKLKSQPASS